MKISTLIAKLEGLNKKNPIYLFPGRTSLSDFVFQGNSTKKTLYICELEHAYYKDYGVYFQDDPGSFLEVEYIEIFRTTNDLVKDLKTRVDSLNVVFKDDAFFTNADYDIDVYAKTLCSRDDDSVLEVNVIYPTKKLKEFKRRR